MERNVDQRGGIYHSRTGPSSVGLRGASPPHEQYACFRSIFASKVPQPSLLAMAIASSVVV